MRGGVRRADVMGLGLVVAASVAARVLEGVAPGWVYVFLVAAWVGGISAVALRWRSPDAPGLRERLSSAPRDVVIDVGALLIAALAWRLLGIGHLPANYLGDEISQAAESWRFATGELVNPFKASDWYGVPYLYMWLGSWFLWALGPTAAAWRGFTAIAGALAVPITYLAVRIQLGPNSAAERREGRRHWSSHVALLAALALCFQHLSLYFSRIGSNQGFDTLFMAAIFLFLAVGSRRPQGAAWFIAGAIAGLGFHFYFALRGVALMTALFVLLMAVFDSGGLRAPWSRSRVWAVLHPLGWYLLGVFLAALPLIVSLAGSDKLNGRMLQVLAPSVAETSKDVGTDLVNRAAVLVQSVQGRGLKGWYESGAGVLVSRLELVLVVVGAARVLRLPRHGWLYVAYPLGVLAAVGLLTENPVASQRVTSVAVGVAALTAFGADHLGRLVWPARRAAVGTLLVGLVAVTSVSHVFLRFLPRRDIDITALVATELIRDLSAKPEVKRVLFCGGDKMDWQSNAALPFFLPLIEVENLQQDWGGSASDIGSGAVLITAATCPDLRDRLLTDPSISARQLVLRTNLGLAEALSMTLETGGVGWLHEGEPIGPSALRGPDEVEVYTAFSPSFGTD